MVPMEVENILTPPDEAFMVEVITRPEMIPMEADAVNDLQKKVPGMTSPPVAGFHAEMVDAMSSSTADLKPN